MSDPLVGEVDLCAEQEDIISYFCGDINQTSQYQQRNMIN